MQINYSQTFFDFANPDDLNIATTAVALHNTKLISREVIIDLMRLDDRGDVSNPYSADLITNGRIRKPFRYNGHHTQHTATPKSIGLYSQLLRLVSRGQSLPPGSTNATFTTSRCSHPHRSTMDSLTRSPFPPKTTPFKIAVGYRTGNHTGSSVPITAEGTGSLLFLGCFDQTDVFFKMARVLSSNTKQLDKSLEQKSKDDIPAFGVPIRTGKGILEP